MNVKQKIASLIIMVGAVIGGSALVAQPAAAADLECGKAKTSIIGGDICAGVKDGKNAEDSAIWKILLLVLNIMTAGVGILGVGGIVYGSIMYASAGDKADQTKKAIGIITNVVIGIIAYALMYLFLNFLIPGGIFT